MSDERFNPRFIYGVNLLCLLAICAMFAMVACVVAAFAGLTDTPMDLILTTSQVICSVLAIGSIVVATRTHREMVRDFRKKEERLRAAEWAANIKAMRGFDWKPGYVLWVKLRDNYMDDPEGYVGEVKKALTQLAESAGIEDPPILVTASDVDLATISVVDLLATVARVQEADEDDE